MERFGLRPGHCGSARWAPWIGLILWGAAFAAGAARATPPVPPAGPGAGRQVQRAEKDGIALELAVEPIAAGGVLREAEHARVRLTVTDSHTGKPISGSYPAAWIDRSGKPKAEGEASLHPDYKTCKEKVEAFLGGSILARPEIDLNVYYVVALNEDNTLSIVDPLFGYGNSKLLAMVFLESRGEDWALSAGGDRLFVSMPEAGKVAVVDTEKWKVILSLPTGKNPGRVRLQADGAYLWVAYSGVAGEGPAAPSGVSVFDARSLAKLAEIETGRGGHDLALSDDSRYAFVTNEGDDTVAVVDVAALKVARTIATGDRPVSVAWSKLAGAAYVVSTGDGAITVVDPASDRPRARTQATPGSGAIRFAPEERFAFIVNTSKDEVHILDASLNQVVQTADVEDEPDQISFTDELAYVRHRGTDAVFMIPWKQVGQRGRQIPAVDFTGGQTPPGRMAVPSPADGIVQAPGAAAVLVANYGDQIIYYYKEGMAAPMGSFKNYGKSPRALLVVDRTLRQVRPGVYETTAKMTGDGTYDVALFLDAPRQVQCFPIQVAENPVLAAARRPKLKVDSSEVPERMRAGAEVTVRVRLTDAETGAPLAGLPDVRFLTFRSPGMEQKRQGAADLGDGRYEIRYTPSEPGLFYVFLEVPSKGLSLQKSPYLLMTAEPADAVARQPFPAPPDSPVPAPPTTPVSTTTPNDAAHGAVAGGAR